MHWAVEAFALFDAPDPRFGISSPSLMDYLVLIDLPGLLIGALVGKPLVYLLGENWSSVIYSVTDISVVTLYWLLIGSFLQFVISEITQIRSQFREVSIK